MDENLPSTPSKSERICNSEVVYITPADTVLLGAGPIC